VAEISAPRPLKLNRETGYALKVGSAMELSKHIWCVYIKIIIKCIDLFLVSRVHHVPVCLNLSIKECYRAMLNLKSSIKITV